MDWLALTLIGFSLPAVALLLLAQLTVYRDVEQPALSRRAGYSLLVGLAMLQVSHAAFLLYSVPVTTMPGYVALLYLVAPTFFLFFRGALQVPGSGRRVMLLHLLPVLVAPLLDPRVAVPLAFVIGAGYALRLTQLLIGLRTQRRHYRLELAVFCVFGGIALAVLVLGVLAPWLSPRWLVLGYGTGIGASLFLVLFLLLRFPDLVDTTREAGRAAYAVSTLVKVDRDAALARLQQAMDGDRLYADENLNLAKLAAALDLTPHQLSELINTGLGIGFSRYLREQRVAAAQRMLRDEPDASVLSVGLAVGFTSQSNFYVAFREITGDVPGRYRKHALSLAPGGQAAGPDRGRSGT